MGPHTKANIPHLLPPVLAALADSKANVRQAAVKTMNTIMTETSVRDMLVCDIFPSALGKGNPFVKQEIFGWFGANLMAAKGLAKDELMACLSVLFSALEDDASTWISAAVLFQPLIVSPGRRPRSRSADAPCPGNGSC